LPESGGEAAQFEEFLLFETLVTKTGEVLARSSSRPSLTAAPAGVEEHLDDGAGLKAGWTGATTAVSPLLIWTTVPTG
jgi:hypothetical protein